MTDICLPIRLVADIGGTHARFALLDADGKPALVQVLKCADYPDIGAAITTYLARVGDIKPVAAVIAIANPVTGDHVAMTNHHWSFSTQALQARLGLESLLVVNDFAALAMSLPSLAQHELVQIGGGVAVPDEPVGVIGPGTGLGVAGLVKAGAFWQPLAGEGGHVTLAAANDFESDIILALRHRFGHVSAERILSGPGLSILRETVGALLQEAVEPISSAEITHRAIDGEDALCVETVTVFCAMLGTVAGNLALTLGARGGIYLSGGILPQLGAFLAQSPFRSRFEEKGRFASYLAGIPCYVIHADQPALIGASRYFEYCEGAN
ncbi:MAG TPA: glucokinase [Novimethylophilus sp.]|jgi:glucokinase|uniref:glucokinase n=1 Tax=Novimethylophilus sp. TaxID=2137426 RepID=UPI002F427259